MTAGAATDLEAFVRAAAFTLSLDELEAELERRGVDDDERFPAVDFAADLQRAAASLSNVPVELRDHAQWVTWRTEQRDGKPTKVPVRVDGRRRASSTDPETWSTFEDAIVACVVHNLAGVGYVFATGDDFCGVDLDHCRNGDEQLHPDAAALLLRLDSYAEWSPSGEGVKVIVKGKHSGSRHKTSRTPWGGAIEVYDTARFFTVTGNRLTGCPGTIEPRQEQLDTVVAELLPERPMDARAQSAGQPVDLDDEELLERAFAARNGADLQALWEGVWEGRYSSQSEADLALLGKLAFWTGPDAARLDQLFRRSGLMSGKWDSRRRETTYGGKTIARALEGRTEFYSPKLGARTGSSSSNSEHEPEPGVVDRALDDIGNAQRFADEHAPSLRYVAAWNQWLRWDGARFAEDDELEHLRRARLTARRLAEEAASEENEQGRKDLLAHARRSASEPRLRAMLTIAASDRRIVVRPRDLDRDPWILNTPSGVVDLRSGELRPHRPEDQLTKLTGAGYDPRAEAELWQAFLEQVLPDLRMRGFLQRLAGLSAIGAIREHLLLILYGLGANGKTVTRNAIAGALGDYAHQSTLDLLLQAGRSVGKATPELADLRGRRLITVGESPEDGRLATERVKWITGGEPITARHLHGNPFTFDPTHTIWLSTNHKPRISEDGEGIWRRVILFDFTVTIPDSEQDGALGDKLAGEYPGILRWIVDGARAYLRQGLDKPATVTSSTASYRAQEDLFGSFLAECAIVEDNTSAQAAAILRTHNTWAEENGVPKLSANALAEKLHARGFQRKRSKTGARWHGLRLINDDNTLDV